MDRESEIRRRAYDLWVRDGRPDGRADEHWKNASEEYEAQERTGSHRMETDPELNNPDSTPGSGMLPDIGSDDPNVQPSS